MNHSTTKLTRTTCPYCGVGCGIEVIQNADKTTPSNIANTITIKPDRTHPANKGRLCSKGMALAETLAHPNRLLQPEINGWQVSWPTATQAVAEAIQKTIHEHGPDAVAFYVSGQLLTEDYYVANKLMKGFIGSANIDTNSRLCMSSAVAAHKRAFGEDLVPCSYEDLEQADLIVLVGSNAAWCHPVLYQRIIQARHDNPKLKLVVIDPRATDTSLNADMHLALSAGSDAFLWNGLFTYLVNHDAMDNEFVQQSTRGLDETIQAAKASARSLDDVAYLCSLSHEDVTAFFQLFASTEKVVSVFSQGINQSSTGTDKGNALINCHLLTGRIGKAGMGPFSFTGQPNAMGGREVGGLANQLAAHLDIHDAQHRDWVKTFWHSPTIAQEEGLKAVDLFKAIKHGKIKLVWIMATNPAVSLPNNQAVRKALSQCEYVIVSDVVSSTDTMAHAHIRLPALAWGERDGTVTNSDRTLSRQRPFLEPPAHAKSDWRIMMEVAHAMGFAEQFDYQRSADIFREHAALSAYHNNGTRCFDIGALASLSDQAYNELQPLQWPLTRDTNTESGYRSTKRLFTDGRYFTPDGLARFIPITPQFPQSVLSVNAPFRLNTGRVRDHWHTLTRTGISPTLSAHTDEAYVDIHPDDANELGFKPNMIVRVFNALAEIRVRARISSKQNKGSVFVPIHWSAEFSSAASVDSLIPDITDPVSGQPESKHAVANITPFSHLWHGFILSRRQITLPDIGFWSCQRVTSAWRYQLAGDKPVIDWEQFIRGILCTNGDTIQWAEYNDSAQSKYRAARFHQGQLESCVFISHSDTPLPNNAWLLSLFEKDTLSNQDKQGLLTGQPAQHIADKGKTVCACFNVGEATIQQAILEQQLTSVEAIGQCLQAGSNCGSCIPELRAYLQPSQPVIGRP